MHMYAHRIVHLHLVDSSFSLKVAIQINDSFLPYARLQDSLSIFFCSFLSAQAYDSFDDTKMYDMICTIFILCEKCKNLKRVISP